MPDDSDTHCATPTESAPDRPDPLAGEPLLDVGGWSPPLAVVEHRFTEEEFLDIARRMFIKTGRTWIGALVAAVLIADGAWIGRAVGDAGIGMGVLILSMEALTIVRGPARGWAASGYRRGAVTVAFAHEGVRARGPDNDTWIRWRALSSTVEIAACYVLILRSGRVFAYVPKSGFTSEGDEQAVRALLAQHTNARLREGLVAVFAIVTGAIVVGLCFSFGSSRTLISEPAGIPRSCYWGPDSKSCYTDTLTTWGGVRVHGSEGISFGVPCDRVLSSSRVETQVTGWLVFLPPLGFDRVRNTDRYGLAVTLDNWKGPGTYPVETSSNYKKPFMSMAVVVGGLNYESVPGISRGSAVVRSDGSVSLAFSGLAALNTSQKVSGTALYSCRDY